MIALIIVAIVLTAFVIQMILLKRKMVKVPSPSHLKKGDVFKFQYGYDICLGKCLNKNIETRTLLIKVYVNYIPFNTAVYRYDELKHFELLNYEK